MLTKFYTFVPVGPGSDNVLITENGYPWAMAFIDMFYDNEDGNLQSVVREGKPFKVKVTFEISE